MLIKFLILQKKLIGINWIISSNYFGKIIKHKNSALFSKIENSPSTIKTTKEKTNISIRDYSLM